MSKKKMNKRGQVWVETVLYTLIGLALIGMALGFIMPKINESRDKILVEQAMDSLASFDDKVNEVIQQGEGNVRQVEFSMKKGELYVNTQNDSLVFVINGLRKPSSELNVTVPFGRINMLSYASDKQKTYSINLSTSYYSNITYYGKDSPNQEKFTPVSLPYKFSIKNEGIVSVPAVENPPKSAYDYILVNITLINK